MALKRAGAGGSVSKMDKERMSEIEEEMTCVIEGLSALYEELCFRGMHKAAWLIYRRRADLEKIFSAIRERFPSGDIELGSFVTERDFLK